MRKIISATSWTRSRTVASRVNVSAPNTVRPRGNEISKILEHGKIVVDRRGLELAPHPGLHDLVLLQLGQLLAAKRDLA